MKIPDKAIAKLLSEMDRKGHVVCAETLRHIVEERDKLRKEVDRLRTKLKERNQ